MNRILSLLIAVLAMGSASAAQAFPHLYFWSDSASGIVPSSSPGAASIYSTGNVATYGTGGAAEGGVTCAHCHTKGPGIIDASVTPTPAWQTLGTGMGYKPGQTYTLVVKLLNETKNAGSATNNLNGFALTIENGSGQGVGTFANDAATAVTTQNCTSTRIQGASETALINANVTTYLLSPNKTGGGCYTVVFVPKLNITQWTLKWTAPAAGTGPVTVYYGIVDGDTSGQDSKNDDVKMGTVKLVEGT